MKKLLIIALFVIGCEDIGVMKHEHKHEHEHSGICTSYHSEGFEQIFSCYPNYILPACLAFEARINNDLAINSTVAFAWIENMTCEEFCETVTATTVYLCKTDTDPNDILYYNP